MAQLVKTELVDDLDGSEARGPVQFSLHGKSYEIDLSEENARRFEEGLARYVAAARRLGAKATGKSRKRDTSPDGPDPATVRAWAIANGHTLSERGRLPQAVVTEYLNSLTN